MIISYILRMTFKFMFLNFYNVPFNNISPDKNTIQVFLFLLLLLISLN